MAVLTESGTQAHSYFFIAGVLLFMIFLVYVYLCEHRVSIEGIELWETAFRQQGMNKNQINDISHDDSMWYYRGRSTCVAYGGDFSEKCYKFENYCAAGDKYGTDQEQVTAVKKAINSGGEHPLCPLIYPGTD